MNSGKCVHPNTSTSAPPKSADSIFWTHRNRSLFGAAFSASVTSSPPSAQYALTPFFTKILRYAPLRMVLRVATSAIFLFLVALHAACAVGVITSDTRTDNACSASLAKSDAVLHANSRFVAPSVTSSFAISTTLSFNLPAGFVP